MWRSALSLIVFAGCALAAAPTRADAPEAPWISLFDGKTLKGWVQRGGAARYEVKDGAIVGHTVPNTKNSFLCTERRYGDFVLELEFKVDAELNSGVQIRSQSRPDYQDGRVHGYQVEIDQNRERSWTGGIYEEGRRGWLADLKGDETARQAYRPGEWNRMRVEARADRLRTWINGVPTADLVDAKDLEGFIALQVHSVGKREEPLTVAWRKLRLQDLGRRAWRPLLPGKESEKPRLPPSSASGEGKFVVASDIAGTLPATARAPGLWTLEKPPGWSAGDDYAFRAEVKIAAGNGGIYLDARPGEGAAPAAGLQVDLDAQRGAGLYEVGGRRWIWQGQPADKAVKSWKKGDWNWVTVSVREGKVWLSLNDLPAAATTLAPGAAGQLAFEVAPTGAGPSELTVRRLEVMSPLIPPPVPGFPIGWCIRANGSAPEEAQAAGFEYVELALQDVIGLEDEAFEQLAGRLERLAAAGVRAMGGYNFFPNELKLLGPEADRAKLDEHIAKGLPRLRRLGLEFVVFNSGPARKAPDDLPAAQARKQLVEFSRRFAREARKHKLAVLLQPLRSTDTNQVTTLAEAVALVRAVAEPNFQLLTDWSFMHIQKDDAAELGKTRGRLRHVWLAKPGPRTYPVSEDGAEYEALFAQLAKLRYRGGLSVHARTDNFFADAPEALRFLRTRAAGLAGRR